jgi:hypothetical protein
MDLSDYDKYANALKNILKSLNVGLPLAQPKMLTILLKNLGLWKD